MCSTERSLPVQGIALCVCDHRAYADNLADAVDQLLMFRATSHFINGGPKAFKIVINAAFEKVHVQQVGMAYRLFPTDIQNCCFSQYPIY